MEQNVKLGEEVDDPEYTDDTKASGDAVGYELPETETVVDNKGVEEEEIERLVDTVTVGETL